MKRPPRPPGEPVLHGPIFVSISVIGAGITIAGLGLFFYSVGVTDDLVRAQTRLFTFIVIAEMVVIQLIRSRYRQTIFSNRWLVAAIVSSLGLQALVVYTPLQNVFDVVPITSVGWAPMLVALGVFVAMNLVGLEAYRRLTQR